MKGTQRSDREIGLWPCEANSIKTSSLTAQTIGNGGLLGTDWSPLLRTPKNGNSFAILPLDSYKQNGSIVELFLTCLSPQWGAQQVERSCSTRAGGDFA